MTDLYKQLENYRDSDFYPFHMPGHKRNRQAASGALAQIYGVDITEIDGFDNLHQAQGILREVQDRAAELYSSQKSYFLVNGSTCGILSAVAAVTGKGGRLLMTRNCHKSVYHAAYLQELKTSYLQPELIEGYKMAGAVTPEEVERALRQYPDTMAVLVTSPTYEGVVSDIGQIAELVHEYGIPLIVDEAHGAHFGFHEAYPMSSVKQGADLVIHSVHKTLPAMTQTALLHVSGMLVDRQRLERYLRIFQTSSPSYVLMASIDSCMNFVEREGAKRLEQLIVRRNELLTKIKGCQYVKVYTGSEHGKMIIDPCKLVISAADGGMTGQELYDILRERYHLQMEMATDQYVLAILTLMDEPCGWDRLAKALLSIERKLAAGWSSGDKRESKNIELVQEQLNVDEKDSMMEKVSAVQQKTAIENEAVMTIAQAYDREWEKIALAQSVGRVAAEFVNLYPPGIPLVVPGEKLDKEMIEKLENSRRLGLNVQGAEDGYINVIRL